MVLQNGLILLCGGMLGEDMSSTRSTKRCLQFNKGIWKEHSTLNISRFHHSAVATQTAIFAFGGFDSKESYKTYEYLPKDSTKWLMGKSEIPEAFIAGCAIAAKSGKEIWLIGGYKTEKRILMFNVSDHTFQSIPTQLNQGRREPRCAFIPNTNKIMITGGFSIPTGLYSTEILDTEDGSITMGNPMNFNRYSHGMGVVTINGEDKLVVFGDRVEFNDSELYNTQSKKWEVTNAFPVGHKARFGFLSVKLADIFF